MRKVCIIGSSVAILTGCTSAEQAPAPTITIPAIPPTPSAEASAAPIPEATLPQPTSSASSSALPTLGASGVEFRFDGTETQGVFISKAETTSQSRESQVTVSCLGQAATLQLTTYKDNRLLYQGEPVSLQATNFSSRRICAPEGTIRESLRGNPSAANLVLLAAMQTTRAGRAAVDEYRKSFPDGVNL